jgi:hypothetical protein
MQELPRCKDSRRKDCKMRDEEDWDGFYEESHIVHTLKAFEEIVLKDYDWWNELGVDVQMKILETIQRTGR